MIHRWCSRCWFTRSTFLLRQARAVAAWIFRCCKLFFIFAAADPIVISAAELVYLGDLAQNMLSHVPGLMMQSDAGNKNVRVEMELYELGYDNCCQFWLELSFGDGRFETPTIWVREVESMIQRCMEEPRERSCISPRKNHFFLKKASRTIASSTKYVASGS